LQLEHAFTVPVGIDDAWAVLLDIERVAPCMPGAAIDSVDGDDFTGTVKVKLGPIGLTYKGKASFVEKDEAAHKAVIRAQGRDARGNGTAAATVTAVLIAEGDTTKVAVTTDLDITGKPAQFGRGVMADVGNKLIGQFADCLAGQLSGGDAFGTTATPDAPTDELPAASADAPTVQLPAASDEPAAAGSAGAPAASAGAPAASAGAPAKKAPAKKAAATKAPAKKVAAASTAGPSTATEAVNGSAPAAESAAAQPAAEPAPQPAAAAPRPIAPRDVEPIDLMHSAGPAVAKRLAPLLGGLLLLLIVLRLIRRR
jgi:carbon monoxide dehydrogenase subunit G